MNNERIATYVGGLEYPKQQKVKHPVAFETHLRLLKGKLIDQKKKLSPFPLYTSSPPLSDDKNLNYNRYSCHTERHQEH
jgi:hypothetical protein